jgi:hypothetical protein
VSVRTPRAPIVTTLFLLQALACSRAHPDPTPTPDTQTVVVDELTLEVENHNWSDIVVFVTHDGVTSRLMQVTANTNVSCPIPKHFVSAIGVLRLSVRRIGGTDGYASEPVSVRTGTTLRLTVESTVARSSVAVW